MRERDERAGSLEHAPQCLEGRAVGHVVHQGEPVAVLGERPYGPAVARRRRAPVQWRVWVRVRV